MWTYFVNFKEFYNYYMANMTLCYRKWTAKNKKRPLSLSDPTHVVYIIYTSYILKEYNAHIDKHYIWMHIYESKHAHHARTVKKEVILVIWRGIWNRNTAGLRKHGVYSGKIVKSNWVRTGLYRRPRGNKTGVYLVLNNKSLECQLGNWNVLINGCH